MGVLCKQLVATIGWESGKLIKEEDELDVWLVDETVKSVAVLLMLLESAAGHNRLIAAALVVRMKVTMLALRMPSPLSRPQAYRIEVNQMHSKSGDVGENGYTCPCPHFRLVARML